MKYTIAVIILVFTFSSIAQERVNPIIENFGGIYEVPEATVLPDSKSDYKIVVDVYGGASDKSDLDRSLNNVARMLNLHAVGGVPKDKISVVIALHGQSTYSTLNDQTYKNEFGLVNPNGNLMKELKEAGVKIVVCGQSLRSRGFSSVQLRKEVEIGVSMLTTVTHYQNQGYKLLKF